MDPWPVTFAARASLLETFEGLDPEQLDTASLCGEWTVREVLAHLTLAMRPPLRRYLATAIRNRSGFDRANQLLAATEAGRPVGELLAAYRSAMTNRFAPPGWPAAAPLADVLIHSMDVRVPLGIDHVEPPEHFEPVLELLTSRFGRGVGGGGRPEVCWTATDHDLVLGDGPSVEGKMADLALTAAGRDARLDRLAGDGAEAIAAWLG